MEASAHPHRNVLTRAVGVAPRVDVDVTPVALSPGDRLLLCTDGVARAVGSGELTDVLASVDEAGNAASAVIAPALEHAEEDNVTALVIDTGSPIISNTRSI